MAFSQTWTQVGQDIDGEAPGDLSGYSVSSSANGTRLAIGAQCISSGNRAGQVRVYDWDGAQWIQLGQDINGEAAGDESGYSVSISADDILMFALDMDNKAFYIGKNGTWMASGDPTSGSSKTGAISEKFSNPTVWADSGPVFPAVYVSSTSGTIDTDYNFGNGNFGTTAVASANADGNGIGKFEYSVPSGYYAICTKNIKEFG
mgnify:CR=1 FL=1